MIRTTVLLLALCVIASAKTHHILCAGLGGEPDYETRFSTLVLEASKLVASPDTVVQALSGPKATKDELQSAIASAVKQATPEDTIFITFIGHGTHDGQDYRFNVRGPDVTAAAVEQWIRASRARIVFVLATSSSGGALSVLRAPNRVIVTATRSGTEKNAVAFPRFWVEALRDSASDTDKNGTISVLEAFRFATLKTARYYESLKRLATEHPLIEDTGQGDGVAEPSSANGQGLLAMRTSAVRLGETQRALASPEKRALLRRKEEIEQSIDKLKYEKAAIPADDYRKQLTALLLELAKLQEEIDK